MNSPNTPAKHPSTDRLLSDRLRQLAINPSGLPPHVVAHLRALVDAEATRIQREFQAAMAALQTKADQQNRKSIARIITLRTVGKAFAQSTTKPPGGAAK